MRSKLAEQLKREQRERFERMTPAERIDLAGRLGEECVRDYMTAHGVDRESALAVFRRSRAFGRPASAVMRRDDR